MPHRCSIPDCNLEVRARQFCNKHYAAWYRANNEDHHQRQRDFYRHLAMEVIIAYGGECTCCGENNFWFLTLDHIENDGAEHRRMINKKGGRDTYVWAKANDYPPIFQVLCANCNFAKQRFGGNCPHKGVLNVF